MNRSSANKLSTVLGPQCSSQEEEFTGKTPGAAEPLHFFALLRPVFSKYTEVQNPLEYPGYSVLRFFI